MDAASRKIRKHDVVRPKHGVGKWPARQKGAVLAEKEDWRPVEIADDRSVMLDLSSGGPPATGRRIAAVRICPCRGSADLAASSVHLMVESPASHF